MSVREVRMRVRDRLVPMRMRVAGSRLDREIVPLASVMRVDDRETGATSEVPVTLEKDEGNRPSTTLAGLAALKPVFRDGQTVKEGRFITAGNASQLSDGASASLLIEAAEAERRGLQPLGAYRSGVRAGRAEGRKSLVDGSIL